jgi:hypothetical protein
MIALAAAAALAPVPRPFKTGLTTVDIERAIELGQSPGSEASQRFHDAHVILIGDPVLDRLEIVTEFRRVVLRTEDRVRLAAITWGPRQAAEMLRPWRARVSLVLHVTFSPRNVYYTMPRFGGMVEATFDASALDHRGVYLAGIDLEGREVRRVELDFGRVD